MKVYRFFFVADDIIVSLAGSSKELPKTAETFLEKTRIEVENEGLKLSVAVDGNEGKYQGHCFVEVFGGEIPRMQQHKFVVFRRWRRNFGNELQDEKEEVVFKREGGEEEMRCEGGALHEKSCFPENSSKRIGERR